MYHGVTVPAEDAEIPEIRIDALEPGRVIEVTTASGACYWITRVCGSITDGKWIFGLMIQTDSTSGQRFPMNPKGLGGDNVVRVGSCWRYGERGSTSRVDSIRLVV